MAGFSEKLRQIPGRGAACILGGILINLVLGTFYSFGNMAPYIVSYGRVRGHTPHLTYEATSFIYSAMILGQGLSMCVGGWLERKIGVRWATFIGVAIFCFSVMASAWTITVSFYFLLFTYGILFGIGTGLAYMPPIVCAMKWMPYSKGLVTGCLLAGYGAGALVFNFVQTRFINPWNLVPNATIASTGAEQEYYTQDAILDRIPFSFLLQGTIFVIVQFAGIALLADPPEKFKRTRGYAVKRKHKRRELTEKSRLTINSDQQGQDVDGDDQSDIEEQPFATSSSKSKKTRSKFYDGMTMTSGSELDNDDEEEELVKNRTNLSHDDGDRLHPALAGDHDKRWSGKTVAPVGLVREVFFWQAMAMFALHVFANVNVFTLYKAFGHSLHFDDTFLAVSGAFASVFNAAGRIFWGHIADKYSFKVSFAGLSATLSVFVFMFPLTIYGGRAMFFIWLCVMVTSIGGVFSTIPTAISRAFGSQSVGMNYGLVFLFGSSIPAVISSVIQLDLVAHLSWPWIFFVTGVFPAGALVMSLFVTVKTREGGDI